MSAATYPVPTPTTEVRRTPPTNLSETLLREATEHSIRAFLEPNAIFLAERLHAAYPSPASCNLLATAHIRQGNYSQAADVLRSSTSTPENQYLYAVCQARINTPASLRDAEAHLRSAHGPIDVELSNPGSTPGGTAGLYLLATICHRTGRKEEATALYRRAASENPTLWISVEALASMGIINNVDAVLPTLPDNIALERLRAQPHFHPGHVASMKPSRLFPPANSASAGTSVVLPGALSTSLKQTARRTESARPTTQSVARSPAEESVYATPSPMPTRLSTRVFGDTVTPINSLQNPPTIRNAPRRLSRRSMSPGSLNGLRAGRRGRSNPLEDSSVRNPNDLFTTPPSHSSRQSPYVASQQPLPSAPGTETKGQDPSVVGSERRPRPEVPASQTMDLLRGLAQVSAELGRFRCTRVIELTNTLPNLHKNTGHVLAVRGRALLEKGDYRAAEQEFLKALQLEPSRMEGVVEYYSTVLWHLKKEKELAQLAIRAQRVYPVSASAWCAAGNCFSLQHDPDTALRYFRRAIATSRAPNAYAHTLCGHEHLTKEDFDTALLSYREALNIDERHYNAMYGIGQVLQKQEKFGLAQNHFHSAVQINPRNSNLHYHLGVSLAAAYKSVPSLEGVRANSHGLLLALAELETAANLDPHNPVPRFERAKILVTMNRLSDARQQLEELRDSLPKEAEVHFELSLVCHKMGDTKNALQALSVALDIEPKERKYKKALETLSNELETVRGV